MNEMGVEPARLEGYVSSDNRPLTEKTPVQWVRANVRGYGKLWLFYNAFVGGDEDDAEEPAWFEIWYHGSFQHEGDRVFGHCAVKVEGKGLDKVIHQLSKGVLTSIKEGKQTGFAGETVITSITMRPFMLTELELR